jgi:DNA-binding NtrC family response regulator
MLNILVVEDKESFREYIKEALETEEFSVIDVQDGEKALEVFKRENIDLVLLDLRLPGEDGIKITGKLKELDATVPIIIITAYGTVDDAVKAMKLGVYDFIEKPVDPDRLLHLVKRASRERRLLSENIMLKEKLNRGVGMTEIIGRSKKIKKSAMLAQKVALSDTAVLLLGESGTGKEVFARAIHNMSSRKNNPFIAVNCGAIPDELFENEFFGSEKGAYTGSSKRKIGMVQIAEGGTLFLDEVTDIPLPMQSKLLRFLEEKTFIRLGGEKEQRVDVRLIAATNKNLKNEVKKGNFRDDLFFRLNVFPIILPPLRERKDDIILLAKYFINMYVSEFKKDKKELAPETKKLLQNYHWPGNIRELKNIIERAIILSEGKTIKPSDVGIREPIDEIKSDIEIEEGMSLEEVASLGKKIAEKKMISSTLMKTGGNKREAAKILRMSYKTFLRRVKEYEI